jgi:hypothetical protein
MKKGTKIAAFLLAGMSIGVVTLSAQSPAFAESLSHKRCAGVFLSQPVVALSETGITGTAKLCVDSHGVRSEAEAQNLTPGYVYSMWFAYIDQPSMCLTPGQCASADFYLGHSPVGVFGRTDSAVAISTEGVFSGNVRSLRLSSGSQVWLVVHFHGPASLDDNRELARQLLTSRIQFSEDRA